MLMDGALGTGLWEKADVKIPVWHYNIENPKIVRELHAEYVQAGSQVINTNTFAANGPEVARDSSYSVEEVVATGVRIAKDAANGRAKVALSVGPLTELLKPFGEISHEQAKSLFEEQIGGGMREKPDIIYLETFMDLEMLKIAVKVANCYDVPVFCSMSFKGKVRQDGNRSKVAHTIMGNSVADIVAGLKDCRVEAVGLNCSLGPEDALPVVAEFSAATDLPIIFKPNAGKPSIGEDGEVSAAFDVETFVNDAIPAVDLGATYIGACCGSNPAYIKRLAERVREKLEAEH